MPFTYLAHQAPALAIKQRWPTSFDGTALAMGSMAPDWAYALRGSRLAFDGHSVLGVLLFCTPVAVVVAAVLRQVAPVLFAYAPNPPRMPLQQLRLLGSRRPPVATSAASACLGAVTHVVWDLFTHNGRWGSQHIAFLRSVAGTLAGHRLSWANVLQYASHVVGSAVAVVLLARILRSGALLRWYGLAQYPGTTGPRPGVARFAIVTAIGTLAGVVWALPGSGSARIIRVSLGVAIGLVAASVACRQLVATGARVDG